MDSVVMTTPSSTSKIRARVRSAFSAVCARTLRKTQKNNVNRQAVAQRAVTQVQCASSAGTTGRHAAASGNSRQRRGSPSAGQCQSRHHQATKRHTTAANATAAAPKQCSLLVRNGQAGLGCGIISEALSVWKPRSPSQPAPPDKLQYLFNQMQLYPTKKQVQQMLHASRRCCCSPRHRARLAGSAGDSPGTSPVPVHNTRHADDAAYRRNSVSFAEFCVYAAELRSGDRKSLEALKNQKNSQVHNHRIARNINVQTSQTSNNINTLKNAAGVDINKTIEILPKISDRVSDFKCEQEYQVFLGGSCNPTTWRTDKAIPALEKLGITYYNPQVSHWSPELIEIEYRAKQCARVMFFVMDDETRSTAGSVEVAQLAAEQRSLVLVVRPYRPGQSILNEKLSPQEFMDLSRNQQILQELVESRGLPVLSTLESALIRTKQLINNEIISTVQTSDIDVAAKLIQLRNTFDALDSSNRGFISIQQCINVLQKLGLTISESEVDNILSSLHTNMNTGGMDSYRNKNSTSFTIDFQHFCGIVAELSARRTLKNSTDVSNTDTDKDNANDIEWVNKQVIYRQSSSNNNTVDNFNLYGSTEDVSYNIIDPYSSKQNHSNNELNNSINKSLLGSKINEKTPMRDIYLGGSCMIRTKWRQKLIIPMLEEQGITYHIPKLHESLVNTFSNDNFTSTCDTSALSCSDKSDVNHPEKRIKYDELSILKTIINSEDHYRDRLPVNAPITKANLTINLINIDRSSSGSSISTVSSLNSPVIESPTNFKDSDSDADMLELQNDFIVPQNSNLYNPALIEGSRVLLFYITNETRSLAPMTLAAFCIGEGRKVVLCIQMLSDDSKIGSEQLTRTAIKDFNRGRAYLADMARREGVPVYDDILLATEKAISMVKEE